LELEATDDEYKKFIDRIEGISGKMAPNPETEPNIEGDHWIPNLYVNPGGYTTTAFKGSSGVTHRFMMEAQLKRKLNANEVVRHKCCIKSCTAPNHLEIGSVTDNINDKIRDNTQPFGQNAPAAKLTEEKSDSDLQK